MALVRVYCGLASANPPQQLAVGSPSLSATVVDDSGRLLDVCDIGDDSYGYAYLSTLLAERASGPYSVAIAADSDQRLVPALLITSGWALAYVDTDSTDDYAERFADELSEEVESAPTQRRALGLARALHAGAISATLLPAPAELAGLKPVLAAHGALATGRHAAAVALREVLRELYPAALRAYPDPADPIALAVIDALPEPGALATSVAGRGRDTAGIADFITSRLGRSGDSDHAAVTEAITALRVAIAETPRRGAPNKGLTATIAEAVRQSVAAVRSCDAANSVLVQALADRVGPTAARGAPDPANRGAPETAAHGALPHRHQDAGPPRHQAAEAHRNGGPPAGVRGSGPGSPIGAGSAPPAPAGPPLAPAAAGGRVGNGQSADPSGFPPALPGRRSRARAAAEARQAAEPAATEPGGGAHSAPPSAPPLGTGAPGPATLPSGGADRNGRAPAGASGTAGLAGAPASGAPAGSATGGRPVSAPPPPPPGITPIQEPRSSQSWRPGQNPLGRRAREEPEQGQGRQPGVRPQGPPPGPDRSRWPNQAAESSWNGEQTAGSSWNGEQPPKSPWGGDQQPGSSWGSNQQPPGSQQPPGGSWGGDQQPGRQWGAEQEPGRQWGAEQESQLGPESWSEPAQPPWRSDDLRQPPEPPPLRLVEPTLPEELKDDLGYQEREPEQPPLRLVEPPSNGIPRSAPPVSADDDDTLLIFAQTRSAWFSGESENDWSPSAIDVGWRAAEQASRQPTVGERTGAGLPRRVPKANLVPGSPPINQDRPLRVVRDPRSIAAHTSGYFNGWRRGQEVGGYPLGGRQQGGGAWDFTRDDERLSG